MQLSYKDKTWNSIYRVKKIKEQGLGAASRTGCSSLPGKTQIQLIHDNTTKIRGTPKVARNPEFKTHQVTVQKNTQSTSTE